MQNRMESNIRDKLLVKMIKLQEFTEKKRIAEMLNEMNPKLKALLAAGLIGTAGLGMQSCSNPSDSVYYPYTVEAPSTDNPGSGGAETSNPSNPDKPNPNGDNEGEKGKTVDKFEELGVTDADVKRRIAKVGEPTFSASSINSDSLKELSLSSVFVYIKGSNPVFQSIPDDLPLDYENGAYGYFYEDDGITYGYIIPKNENLKNSFDKAIEAYKASHNQ